MDRYKNRCYYETFRKNIFPVKTVKYYEKDKIYLSLGSLIFFKDPFTLNRRDGFNKSNYESKNHEISLKCAICKNDRKITNVIEIKVKDNVLSEVCYGKHKPSTPTYRNYKNSNLSHVLNRRGVKFKIVSNKLLVLKKRGLRIINGGGTSLKDKDRTRSKTGKLRVPIIVKINNVLVFKLKRRRSGLSNRLNNCKISLSLELYVNNCCISTNRKRIVVPLSQYNTPRKSTSTDDTRNGYSCSSGCIFLYIGGMSGASDKGLVCTKSGSTEECCCDVEDKKVCYKHISGIIELIICMIDSISGSDEFSFSGGRGSGGISYRRYALYKYLQVLYYLVSSDVNVCCEAGVPVSMVTFRTVENVILKESGDHNCQVLCSRLHEILYRHSSLLSIDGKDLLFIEIPMEFKLLQLMYNSSLLGVSVHDSGGGEQHKIKIYNKWHTYSEISTIVYKYYSQLAKSPNSICLLLRFTDRADSKRYELLTSYLEKLEAFSDNKHSTGNTGATMSSASSNIGDGASNRPIISSNVVLELTSGDFVSLDEKTRRKIISILIKNVNTDLLRRYFRQFLFFLKYDIGDMFFNYVLKMIKNDLELSLKMYFFLLSFTSTTRTTTNTKESICEQTSCVHNKNYTSANRSTNRDNAVYLECLLRYVQHLTDGNDKVLSVIKLEHSFLSIFICIINIINRTRRKYLYRNYYLQWLLNQLVSATTNRGKIELDIDRDRKLIKLSPYVPLVTDVNCLIKAINYERSYIYKSSNYPLVLHLTTSGDGGGPGDVDRKVMLKMNYVRNDELCLEVLSLFKRILRRYKIQVLTYKVISIYKNLGYIQFIPSVTSGAEGGDLVDEVTFKENFINSFSVISILNYLLEVGDRHYENVMLQTNGVLINFDFNFIFGHDPSPLKKPPFRFSSRDLEILERLGAYSEFVDRFIFIFGLIRRKYKSVLNLLYTSGVDIADVTSVESRFMLDLSNRELKETLINIIRQSHNSNYPQFIDKWHRFTNLFK